MKKTKTTRTQVRAPKKPPIGEVDPRFAPIVEAFRNDRHVTYGKMFASMGLKVNGKIFAMLVNGKFVAKLPKERVDALVRSGKGAHFDPGHGRLMKEWVTVGSEAGSWTELAREAHVFVKGGRA